MNAPNVTSSWKPDDYAENAAFVPALGAPVLALLDPKPGERILDLGCGDGVLTEKIVEVGAEVIGVDASDTMIAAAKKRGLDARVMDGEKLAFDGEFDAVFSNAALHWMLDPAAVAAGVFRALKPGGRFVGEQGGEGNIAVLRSGLRAELTARGYYVPDKDPQWYASPEEFSGIYGAAGFENIEAGIVPRLTELPNGVAAWLTTFRTGFMDHASVPEAEQAEVAAAVEKRLESQLKREDGIFIADYVRLRFSLNKPD